MADLDDTDFPYNVVELLKTHLVSLDGVTAVVGRPLWPTDANGSLGVVMLTWGPDNESIEMGLGESPAEVTISIYTYVLQFWVKNANEEEGERVHAEVSKRLRRMLYRDNDLRLALRALSFSSDGSTERLKTWAVTGQRFSNNQLTDKTFIFLSVTEFQVQTETV